MSIIALNTVPDLLENTVAKFPKKTAVIFEGDSLSYCDVDERTNAIAASLQHQFGVQKGDRVCVVMPNCLEFYLAYWSIVKLGGIVVPVNIRLKPEAMKFIIHNSDAKVVFVHHELWDSVSEALKDCPLVEHVITAGDMGHRTRDKTAFTELVQSSTINHQPSTINPDDLILIMHTSGTTGTPKGAMVTHGNLLFNIRMAIIGHSLRHEDVHLLVLPMFTPTALYTMLPASAYLASTIVICPKPDIALICRLIEQHRCTTLFSNPTLCYFLTHFKDLDRYDLSSLRLIAYAGAPMPLATIKALREKFPNVWLHNFFGLTETISMTHVLPNCDAMSKPESIGKVLPEVFQRIVDEDGNDVPPGTVGELCFHKSNVVQGYWKQPERFQEAMLGDWFRTGDLALMDEDGYVYLKGRKKDMLIVMGENVYALEVENVILEHPKVMEVAVVGVEAKGALAYLGELIKAVVVPKPGESLTEQDVKRHCARRLPSFKVPHIVEFRDSLPRNPAGKVLKGELK